MPSRPSETQLPAAVAGSIADSNTSFSWSRPRILDLSHHLDPSVEITMHHVRAADPELADGAEMNNPRVFEEPAEDRAPDDVLQVSRRAGSQPADAAHHYRPAPRPAARW